MAWDDGDPASWVTARYTALEERNPLPTDVQVGMPVLALYEGQVSVKDGEDEAETWFPAKVITIDHVACASSNTRNAYVVFT